jgi:hypothetical protein
LHFVDSYNYEIARSDGAWVDWRCEADLPMGAKLVDVVVQCEGFDYPDDPYILADSCGVSFSIVWNKFHYVESTALLNSDKDANYWNTYMVSMVIFVIVLFLGIILFGVSSPRKIA